MYKIAVVAFVAFVALQTVDSAATKPAPQESGLQQFAANVQTVVNNASAVLQGNLPDSKDVVQTLSKNAQNLANSVQEVVNKLKTEVKARQPDIDNAIKQIEAKLSETKVNLDKALGPEGQKKAQEIKQQLDKSLKDAAAQGEKLIKAIEPEAEKAKSDLNAVTKNFLDQIVKVGQDLQQQLETSSKKN